MAELDTLQRWLFGACLGGPPADPQAMIAGSEAFPAEARLSVYVRGYQLRLLDCLSTDFPALRSLVGEDVFALFARGYLAARPSRSWSLDQLGAGFADWLEQSRPARADPLDRLPADLARLERARAESRRAPGIETLAGAGLSADAALVALASGLKLRTPESLRLVRAGFVLEPLIAAVDRGEPAPTPEAGESFYAVARSRYRVRLHTLSASRFALLEACRGEGASAMAAAAWAAEACGVEIGPFQAELAAWLPAAVEAGILAAA